MDNIMLWYPFYWNASKKIHQFNEVQEFAIFNSLETQKMDGVIELILQQLHAKQIVHLNKK